MWLLINKADEGQVYTERRYHLISLRVLGALQKEVQERVPFRDLLSTSTSYKITHVSSSSLQNILYIPIK